MKQSRMYCVVCVRSDKKELPVYVCAKDISEACAMGEMYMKQSPHLDECSYIKQINECKIKPYIKR